ncbi:Putative ankyrin repeat protein RF_0381 [Araneus ventricosus]|uniref:Ankyrin repeat protein RF_0381 n=1 Tax=Araneus ventricosus TaxID=182803 RepID=A0A4Y2UHY6_ARAVE|nr:Putative ankyrin repeat protein RF_0381 [Araneus ventricosus]
MNVNIKSDSSCRLLGCVAESGNLAILKFIVSKGVDVNTKNQNGYTLLHNVPRSNKLGIVIFLVSRSCNVDAKNEYNDITPLHYATCSESSSELKNVKDKYGLTPLSYAIQLGKSDIVQLFLESGADLNAKYNNGDNIQ